MTDPWVAAEREMAEAGHSLDKIPEKVHQEHLWADGLLLWWMRHHKLPSAWDLAVEMFDEWDDPVDEDEAQRVLNFLEAVT